MPTGEKLRPRFSSWTERAPACNDFAGDGLKQFKSEKELERIVLASERPSNHLVEIWNSFAGVAPFDDLKPVKKFTDRKAGIARIRKAIQRLAPKPAAKKEQPASKTAPAAEAKAPREGTVKCRSHAIWSRPSPTSFFWSVTSSRTSLGWQLRCVDLEAGWPPRICSFENNSRCFRNARSNLRVPPTRQGS